MAVSVALCVALNRGQYTAVTDETPFAVRYRLKLQNQFGIEHNSARWQDQVAALLLHVYVEDNTLMCRPHVPSLPDYVYFQTQVPSILPPSVLLSLSLSDTSHLSILVWSFLSNTVHSSATPSTHTHTKCARTQWSWRDQSVPSPSVMVTALSRLFPSCSR